MISIKALGMYSSDFSGGETRNGDTQIVTDGEYYDVIDGGCDRYATRLIAHLRTNNIRDPYLHASHPHYDHIDGINKILSDPWFTPRGLYCQDPDSITAHNSSIRSDINALRDIVNKAKKKEIPVIFLDNEQKVEHGEIKITVYRQHPKYSGNSDAYLNDGSLCYWFAEQRYLTTGDASMWCAYKYNLNPLIVKGGHHGNDMSADGYLKPSQMCPWLYKHGCRYYWDNDFSTKLTDFLMTGREDAINAGMIFLDIHGDIDMIFACGKVTITHAGKTYTDSVPYSGEYKECWVKNTVGWWYRYKDGSWPADCCVDLRWSQGIDTFCFNKRGYMVTGWQKIGGKWYFFDEKSGAMKKGWIFWDGSWFYLDPETGVMYHTCWIDYKAKRCYLEPSGRALRNCVRVIDGKTYQFDDGCYATEVAGDVLFTKAVGKLNDVGSTRLRFVLDIANYVRKYAPQYGIKVYSPIIAQAIHESGWGESKLSAKYHNYFGLKCGTAWKGKSVNMSTQEEYSAGTLTTISANFRAYDSMEEGVKGYFEFIQLARYANLKGITSPRKYLETIIADGYATGKQYVDHAMNLINLYNLTQFDVIAVPIPKPTEPTKTDANPVDMMIQIMDAELGYHEGANNHTKYGDEMHKIQPSNMDANAAWCDCWFDWCILQLCKAFGYDADMAREVLCGDFDDYTYSSVNLYKKQGRWFSSPQKGDQIFFGGAGHTGGVVDVKNGEVYTDEGNKSDQVMRCSYKIGDSRILGYGRPKYELLSGGLTADNMPLIKKGATGFAVVELQKRLNAASYNGKIVLTVDGDFGDNTYNALKAYQKDRGLEVDGECGKNSWQSLFNEV